MKNIISNKVLTGRQYLELATGKYYTKGDTQSEIEEILARNGFEGLWNFPLDEINEVIENDIRVVLVQCCKEENYTEYEYRWFEVFDDISDEELQKEIENL